MDKISVPFFFRASRYPPPPPPPPPAYMPCPDYLRGITWIEKPEPTPAEKAREFMREFW